MTDLEKLAEHIISAQYSYDTPTQKAELIRAFIDGARYKFNDSEIYHQGLLRGACILLEGIQQELSDKSTDNK